MIHNIIIGVMGIIIAYAMFTCDEEELEQTVVQDEPQNDVVINGRKYHQLSCQTCRKIKNHVEIKPRVFQCNKCKRETNLNHAS